MVGVYVGGGPQTCRMNPKVKSFLRGWLPTSVRTHRVWAGPLRGYRIVTSWHDYPAAILGRTEHPLLEWFAANVKPGETWLDVGAHYGYTATALCRLVGSSGRVFAFEPMLTTAGYLTQTRRLNSFPHLIVLPFGLAAPETLEIKYLPVTRGMVDSTLESGRAGDGETDKQKWKEAILVARFDWLWPHICGGDTQIDGVKIDVQGMEVNVLHGMLEMLRHHRPKLVVEVHRGVDRVLLLDLIETAGYSRQAMPIEPVAGEVESRYVDDRSYAFEPR
jgi:FkbM family methyltransferase